MTDLRLYHHVCHDCDAEALKRMSEREAEIRAEMHENATGHSVDYLDVDDREADDE